jgi:alkylhydroperoxidase family enzyme
MPRIPYSDLPPDSPAGRFLAKLPLNVARMMAHSPDQMLAFQRFGEAVLSKGALDPRLRELAILRVGHRLGAAYETHHHERIGRAVGMSEAQIEAARSGDGAGLPERDRMVLACANELESDGSLPDALFADLARVFSHQELVELVLATGFYGMVSRFLNAFWVEVEEGDGVRLRVVEG